MKCVRVCVWRERDRERDRVRENLSAEGEALLDLIEQPYDARTQRRETVASDVDPIFQHLACPPWPQPSAFHPLRSPNRRTPQCCRIAVPPTLLALAARAAYKSTPRTRHKLSQWEGRITREEAGRWSNVRRASAPSLSSSRPSGIVAIEERGRGPRAYAHTQRDSPLRISAMLQSSSTETILR